ncbi:two-component sensor histidine kinase [Luteitalea sp. TBR-22]|uniref:sensor histidine kinase n=1 Tax=Luteitalea sp. TBR-22 TaxID=2802971 RepID=UPI001AFC5F73|nr:HAMP domain-containing sensor histidine kinase [Luteitalea sp. TBR-22]BCS31777.1 two-component sensor histidine kinase [Luteitalea sp. TBR-22]
MTRRNTATIVFVSLCVVLVAAAVTLNVGWIYLHGRRVLPLVLGVLAFALIIAGIIVYTVFLVRELHRNDQQDAFLNAVTHELKTPIASIRLYLQTLQAREVSEAQRADFYRIMLADADRLQQTVELVLKAGAAGQRLALHERHPVDLAALAAEVLDVARLRHHLGPDAMTLDTRAAEGAWVEGDAEDLRSVLSNLLDNAVKYSRGLVRVTLDVDVPESDRVRIRVSDQGVGIPQSQLKRIFRRFHRFQWRGSKVKGTGLGLYIVRSIVRRHGGRVFAASEGEGRGSTFTIELPRMGRP